MQIRTFEPADAEQVVALHRRAVEELCSDDYTAEQIDAWTDNSVEESVETAQRPEIHRFVAVVDGTVVGFGEYNAEQAEITGLYVDPDWTGNGIGAALLDRVETDAARDGIDALTCFSTVTARTFYEAHGYTVVEQVMYDMDGTELPAYHMEKTLP